VLKKIKKGVFVDEGNPEKLEIASQYSKVAPRYKRVLHHLAYFLKRNLTRSFFLASFYSLAGVMPVP
jgi:hypothetical protein